MVLRHQIDQSPFLDHKIDSNAFFIDYPATTLTTFSSWTSTIATSVTQTAIAALVALPIYQRLWRDREKVTLDEEQISLLASLPDDGWPMWIRGSKLDPMSPNPNRIVHFSINKLGTTWAVCFLLG